MRGRWTAPTPALLTALLVAGLAGCDEDLPTGADEDLVPISVRTIEIELPFADFGSDFRTFEGFGSPAELSFGLVADGFEDVLDARTLVQFPEFIPVLEVTNEDGSTVFSAVSVKGGRLVARFDTVEAAGQDPPELVVNAIEFPWHAPTATWTVRVDTPGVRTEWDAPGADPAELLDRLPIVLDEETDSLVLDLDSARVASLVDTADVVRDSGIRLDAVGAGARATLSEVFLLLDAVPEVRPDTVVEARVNVLNRTFIFDPPPPPPTGIRVGGAPAWRTTMGLSVPTAFDGPPELCDAVGCPFTLDADQISVASLLLETAPSPPGFAPTDSVRVDVRPVLAADLLPKSPLGGSLVTFPGIAIGPDRFRAGAGARVAVPITPFVRDLIRGETSSGRAAPTTLSLMDLLEPFQLGFATFTGPESDRPPLLRLVITVADTVEVR